MMRALPLLLLLFLFSHCEEPIEIDIKTTPKDYLVVDGTITTEEKNHLVIISRATPFKNADLAPLQRESVNEIMIVDDNSQTTTLFEVETGVYSTPASFAAKEGSSYQLKFTTVDGQSYESTPQKIYQNGEISNIGFDYRIQQVYTSSADQFVDKGVIQITGDYRYSDESAYLAFDYDGTFIFNAPNDPTDCYVPDEKSGYSALRSGVSFDDKNFAGDELFSVNYDFKFRNTYSLNLKMYTIGRDAYSFLSDVQEQINSTGSIFDPAPQQIIGNIVNTNDEGETILGFFGAFNVTEQRIFIRSNDLAAPEPFDICGRINGPGNPPNYCFDCSNYFRSTKIKPNFWQ
ncbi:MAG: DUF4249 domain-containing protein [Cyclobacteriaceae bacterium]